MEFIRLRKDKNIRDLLSEVKLLPEDFIMPYFVIEGKHRKEEIRSMPGVFRFSIDNLIKEIQGVRDLGLRAVLLFGIPSKKDEGGSEAYKEDGVVQRAVKAIKDHIKDIVVITDVCLCAYTSHGHCGIIKEGTINYAPFTIDNDETVRVLARIALSHARLGVDFVAPSAMMDGQVKIIRETLDREGFKDVGVLGYSAKYASNFYAPFREALDSIPRFGDRKSYQMDFRNSNEALREIEQDIKEGADIVMVKPALAYLDIICKARERFNIPIAAYNVSGEYSMIKRWIEADGLKEKDLVFEVLTSIKRAGADLIISYFAKDIIRWID